MDNHDGHGITEYERQRLETIARNRALLASLIGQQQVSTDTPALGLAIGVDIGRDSNIRRRASVDDLAVTESQSKRARLDSKKKQTFQQSKDSEPDPPRRMSLRVRGLQPDQQPHDKNVLAEDSSNNQKKSTMLGLLPNGAMSLPAILHIPAENDEDDNTYDGAEDENDQEELDNGDENQEEGRREKLKTKSKSLSSIEADKNLTDADKVKLDKMDSDSEKENGNKLERASRILKQWIHSSRFLSTDRSDAKTSLDPAWNIITKRPYFFGSHFTRHMPARISMLSFHPANDRAIFAVSDTQGNLGLADFTDLLSDAPSNDDNNPQLHSKNEKNMENTQQQLIKDSTIKTPRFLLFNSVHQTSISSVCFNKAGTMFTSSYDANVRKMDPVALTMEHLFSSDDDRYKESITSIAPSEESTDLLWIGGSRGSLWLKDVRSPSVSLYFQGLHDKKIGSLSVSPAFSNLMCSASHDKTACIWDVRKMRVSNDPKAVHVIETSKSVTSAALNPIHDSLLLTCKDNTLRVWHGLRSGTTLASESEIVITHDNNTGRFVTPFRAVWLHDGLSFVVGSMDRSISAYQLDAKTHTLYAQISWTHEALTSIPAINASHRSHAWIASANSSGKLSVWKG